MSEENGVMQIRNHLLDELALAVRTSNALIEKINPEEWTYRPKENMRTLLELVQHLVSVPASDLAIMQEHPQSEVERIENEGALLTRADELAERFTRNYEQFRVYLLSLSEENLLHQATKAFYMEHGTVQIKWLIETVTHAFHHRSQLYNYLKQQGHELNFVMLYG